MSTWIWFRIDARRRWRSLVVLALLIAVSGATVLTAVAGARRGETALPRLTARTLPATVEVAALQPGFDWEPVRRLPEVEAMATYVDTDFRVEGIPPENLSIGYPPGDTELMRTIERPVVLEGRLADPDRADEVVVTRKFVTTYGKGVGDTVIARLLAEHESDLLGIIGRMPTGPRMTLRIVGVVRSPWIGEGQLSHGVLLPTPALLRQYGPNLLNDDSWYSTVIRLKGGEAAIPAFRDHLARVTGRSDILVDNLPEQQRRRQHSNVFEARWLLAFGAAAFLAAVVLIGQALNRYVATSLAELPVLRALGMSRGQVVLAAAAGPLLAAAAGAAGAVTAAAVASRWFPIGSAANAEPSPGMDLDWLVLAGGFGVIVLLVLVAAAASAWLTAAGGGRATGRHSAVATAAARAHLPVPVVVGTRFALEPARGAGSVPVRPALFGAIAGVLGIVAAFTFSAGVSEAAGNPARFGVTWQLETWMGFRGEDVVPPALLQKAAADPDVAAVADLRAAVATEARRRLGLILYTYSPVGHPVDVVLSAGRMPASPSELVLAPESARTMDVNVGDVISLSGTTGTPRVMTVSGIGFVPAGSHCSGCSYASGAWVTDAGFDSVFRTFQFHVGFVAVKPGARVADVAARLGRLVSAQGSQSWFAPPYQPTAIAELRRVQPFPLALAAFLSLLAIAAVGHAVASAVRRRRHDVAVLRALGMTPWQSRAVLITQSSVLAVVGLVFGVPLGVAAGRVLWHAVADYTPLQYAPPFAVLALLLVAPAALLAANLLAAWPGRAAARLRIGQVLRAE